MVAILAGCSSAPGDAVGTTSESLNVLVHLPQKLGGVDKHTQLARHTAPKHLFPMGLEKGTARVAPSGGLVVESLLGAAPPSVDLSQYAPSPGDQGQTGSCAAWATGYSAMGWWAAKSGLSGTPYAPMFVYAQEVRGDCEQGTTLEGNLDILQQQGIDTDSDYQPMQSQLDCATQPNASQQANAASHRITGYQTLDLSRGARAAIEPALAAGLPVILGIQVYSELMNASAGDYLVGPPQAGDKLLGGHAITGFKYDENGVWILNSWTSQWGNQGWAELSWEYLEGSFGGQPNLMDVAAITGVAGGSGPTPPTPTPPGPTPPGPGGGDVTFDAPVAGEMFYPGDPVTVAVSAGGSAAIASASLDWQSPGGHATFALQSMGNGEWGITMTLSAQAASGPRTLTVTTTDTNGQSSSATETVSVQ